MRTGLIQSLLLNNYLGEDLCSFLTFHFPTTLCMLLYESQSANFCTTKLWSFLFFSNTMKKGGRKEKEQYKR